ncbi:MAG: ABC transporter permease [Niabella sp.]
MSANSQNPAWQRLRKNKGAMASMVIIALSVLVAVFCYSLASDHTPYANRIILEVGGKKPGFTQQFLLVKKQAPVRKVSFLSGLINGWPDIYDFVPITWYATKADSIIAEKYIDEGVSERISFPKTGLAVQPVQAKTFWLGTDSYGRDILSRLVVGTRVSLSVGLVTVLISISIGLLLGSLAGYYRGITDSVVMWFINVIWSIPTLLLVFAITLALGKGFWQVFIAIGLTMWVNVARLVRGQVLAVRQLEYVEATRALGYSDMRAIAVHIWPNILGPVLVIAAANFASAIIIEAGLSFLGVGVQPPQPSWGLMIKENYNFIITQNPILALAPGIAIMLLVLAFNLLGNGLRDALDVK